MKISKYGNIGYGNVFENYYHILTFKYGKIKTYGLVEQQKLDQFE